jgi:type II secretory pathway pseudopilin PulG
MIPSSSEVTNMRRALLLAGVILLAAMAGAPVSFAQTTAADREHAADLRFDACKAHLQQAKRDGVLLDLKWAGRKDDARVTVSAAFAGLTDDAKQAFARDVNCFMTSAEDGKIITFDIVDPQTDRRLGQWTGTELVVY